MQNTTILITGASGFIGQYLIEYFLQKNFNVIALTRQKNKISQHAQLLWINTLQDIRQPQIDYVINLAGENIGAKRWTEKRKQQLIQSRITTTQQIFQWLAQHHITPKRIISGSAIGYYGIDRTEQWTSVCDEQAPAQDIFQSRLCQQWEDAALQHPDYNTKIIRLGIVFGSGGGILPQMLLPIKLNLIGRMGSGRQPVVWVHIADVARAIEFLFYNDTSQSIYNLVAPEHLNQKQFAKTSAALLKRKPLLFLPDWFLQWALGEQSQLVLNGQFVYPHALLQENFSFSYTDVHSALHNILKQSS